MAKDDRGIYRKYEVKRTDGSSGPGGYHEHCAYFVLDLEHDPYAIPALKAYAKACKKKLPELARDLRFMLRSEEASHCTRFIPNASEVAQRLMEDSEDDDHA